MCQVALEAGAVLVRVRPERHVAGVRLRGEGVAHLAERTVDERERSTARMAWVRGWVLGEHMIFGLEV